MSVLVFAELENGQVKKSSIEAIYYGAEVAKASQSTAKVLVVGTSTAETLVQLGAWGATEVLWYDQALDSAQSLAFAQAVSDAIIQENSTFVVVAKSILGDAVAARVAAKHQAALATNVVDLPDLSAGVRVKRSIYTGKAFATVCLNAAVNVIVLKKNAVMPVAQEALAQVKIWQPSTATARSITVVATHKASGTVALPEADLVVSAGRGLKGPENWGIVEDLAKALGAATACSKPVSDLNWRPHHEHVGQTGLKVAPNLYIACGISGAIQHLAGVNSSKVIVVINKDPEAPFFKAADYGIVGDVFEVLPRLTKALQ